MSPILALDLGNGRNIASAKGCSFPRQYHEKQGEDQEHAAPAHPNRRHLGKPPVGVRTTKGGLRMERSLKGTDNCVKKDLERRC